MKKKIDDWTSQDSRKIRQKKAYIALDDDHDIADDDVDDDHGVGDDDVNKDTMWMNVLLLCCVYLPFIYYVIIGCFMGSLPHTCLCL